RLLWSWTDERSIHSIFGQLHYSRERCQNHTGDIKKTKGISQMENVFVLQTDDKDLKNSIGEFLSKHSTENNVNVAIYELKPIGADEVMNIVKQKEPSEIELKSIYEKQHQALLDIHSVVFLNMEIPEQERENI